MCPFLYYRKVVILNVGAHSVRPHGKATFVIIKNFKK